MNIINDPSLRSSIPFYLNENVPITNLKQTPFLIAITNGTYSAVQLTPGALNDGYLAALSINGSGRNQTSEILVATGNTSQRSSPTTFDRPTYLSGRIVAQTKFGPNSFNGLAGAFTSSTPASGVSPFVQSQIPTDLTITSDATSYGDTFPAPITTSQIINGVNTATTYTFSDTATQTALPVGLGTSRTTQTLSGYSIGLNQNTRPNPTAANPFNLTSNSPPLYFVASSQSNPGAVQINTDAATSLVAASFNLSPALLPSGTPAGFTGSNFVANFGTTSAAPGTSNQRVGFVDDSHFAAQTSLQTSPSSNPQAPNSSSNSLVNGQTPTNTNDSFIVTATGIEPTNLLPPGTSFCQCKYLQWGFFGTAYTTNNGQQTDRVNLGTWVAGPLASPTDMPQSGTAAYSGHAIGTVYNFNNFNVQNGTTASYVAAGGFTNQWNFGSRSGTLTISNFDGATYTGGASSANGRDFVGALAGAGRTGTTGGSFFKGGGDPAAETGGQFRISGPGYQAGGIFAGAKR